MVANHGGQHILPLVFPIKGSDGSVRAVVALALSLDWLGQQIEKLERPPNGAIVVADRDGTILARYPDHAANVGKKFLQPAMALIAAKTPGVATVPGFDGKDRLIGYVPPAAPPEGLWVSVGLFLPDLTEDIERATTLSLGFTLAGSALAVALSLWLGTRFIRRPTNALLRASRRWRAGDLSARARVRPTDAEFFALGGAFNAMAESLERRDAALRESEERHRLAADAAGLGTWHVDFAAGAQTWSDEIKRMAGLPPDAPMAPSSLKPLFTPDDWEALKAGFRAACQPDSDGTLRGELKFRRADDGAERWALVLGRILFDARRKPERAVAVVMDVTERRQVEETQRLLLHELNHRVKNTLATVQAIALQTLRHTADPDAFIAGFQARLLSLSSTHNLLTTSGWQSASLATLIRTELTPYLRAQPERALLQGPELELSPRQAVAMGMVFHELTTNAAKYGALASPDGRIDVTWSLGRSETGPHQLRLDWVERGGPAVTPPTRTGFGSRLIRRTIEGEFAGAVTFEYSPAGLRCRIQFALDNESTRNEKQPLAAE
jgi:PAS domain S-box-containing protein